MAGRKLGAKRAKAAGRSESGQAVVLSVVWMVVLLGMAGLVIDVGSWYRSQRDLQADADAAALAGAQDLPNNTSTASTQAKSYALKNGFIAADQRDHDQRDRRPRRLDHREGRQERTHLLRQGVRSGDGAGARRGDGEELADGVGEVRRADRRQHPAPDAVGHERRRELPVLRRADDASAREDRSAGSLRVDRPRR